MRRHPIVMFLGGVLIASLFATAFGYAVQGLWNYLMPDIFGLKTISFLQGIGLLALSWIFFGSWRGFGWHGGRHRQRWARMSVEERERFRAHMRSRWHADKQAPNDSAAGDEREPA